MPREIITAFQVLIILTPKAKATIYPMRNGLMREDTAAEYLQTAALSTGTAHGLRERQRLPSALRPLQREKTSLLRVGGILRTAKTLMPL